MDLETRERVLHDFDLLRMESGAPRIYEAFAQAVALESGLFTNSNASSIFGKAICGDGGAGE